MQRRKFIIDQPGSPKAIEQGCICPVKENNGGYGNGFHMDYYTKIRHFVISPDCPVHTPPKNKLKGGQ